MIRLDYRLANDPGSGPEAMQIASADELTLRYQFALGDQIFQADHADLSACWGWIPLLDFAASLVWICRKLSAGSCQEELDFTDSDEVIRFQRQSDQVRITATYSNAVGMVPIRELAEASEQYAARLRGELEVVWPGLRENRQLRDWYPTGT